jgi:phosphogluconate dehydratase
MHAELERITSRIATRSAATRQQYLDDVTAARDAPKGRDSLSAGNKAHAFAACPVHDKQSMLGGEWPNIAIISAYNDMLSGPPALSSLSRYYSRRGARLHSHGAICRRRAGHV